MRQVVYWKEEGRLVYLDENATPEFWDSHWRSEGKPATVSPWDDVVTKTRRYLARGSRVLEGGCGSGDKLKAIADAGFHAIGVDFAHGAVGQAKFDFPELDIRQGDVRSLDFPDRFFDGYWSIGVIEHFWGGYEPIMAEAARVLREGGILFLSAPWFSPYRKYKAYAGGYACANFSDEPGSFYQFALGRQEVTAHLARHGFELLNWHGQFSEISMKEDMPGIKRQIDWLLGSRGTLAKRVVRRALFTVMNPICGHSFLAIARCRG